MENEKRLTKEDILSTKLDYIDGDSESWGFTNYTGFNLFYNFKTAKFEILGRNGKVIFNNKVHTLDGLNIALKKIRN